MRRSSRSTSQKVQRVNVKPALNGLATNDSVSIHTSIPKKQSHDYIAQIGSGTNSIDNDETVDYFAQIQNDTEMIAPQIENPFSNSNLVSTALVFDGALQGEIKGKIGVLQKKIMKLEKSRQKLIQDNKELNTKLLEMEVEDDVEEEAWLKAVKIKKINLNTLHEKEDIPLARNAVVQELMQGYVSEMQKLEDKLIAITDENEMLGLNDKEAHRSKFKQSYDRFHVWLEKNYPLNSDLRWAQINYGAGISAFFTFYRYTLLNSCIICLLWMFFCIKQSVAYHNGNGDFSAMSKSGTFPNFITFSQFSDGIPQIYGMSVVLTMVALTYSSLEQWLQEDKQSLIATMLSRQGQKKKQAELAFNFWNFNVIRKQEAYEQKIAISEDFRLLLKYTELESKKQSRSKRDAYILYGRRALGIFSNTCLVASSWFAIINIVTYQTSISSFFSSFVGSESVANLAPSILITGVGLLLPQMTFAITTFEKWDDQIQTIKQQITRLYLGRILNLVVVGLQYYSLRNHGNTIVPFFDQSIVSLTAEFADGGSPDFVCFEDKAAQAMVVLIISDFFVSKLAKIATYYVKETVSRCTTVRLQHSAYNVAESTIDILYSQGLLWITLPLFPFISFLAPFLFLINFKWEKRVLSKYKSKPTAASWKPEDTGPFFIIYYNFTLVLGLVALWYFVQASWPCYDSASTANGAFSETLKPVTAIKSIFTENGAILKTAEKVMTNAGLYLAVALTLLIVVAFKRNKDEAMKLLLHSKNQEIEELYKKLLAQKRKLELRIRMDQQQR